MKNYGSINYNDQRAAGISIIEYLLCEQIHYLGAGVKSRTINGWVMAKRATFAAHFGVSDRTIRNYIANLRELGFIEVDDNTKMIRTGARWHYINERKNNDSPEKISGQAGKNFRSGPEKISGPTKKREKKKVEKKKDTPLSPPGGDAEDTLESDFEKFWKAYPKKKSKADALKAFQSTGKNRPPTEELLKILELHKASPDWIKNRGMYIPYAGSWLRAERWNDEIEGVMTEEDRNRFGINASGPNYFEELAREDETEFIDIEPLPLPGKRDE